MSSSTSEANTYFERIRAGDRAALAQAITLVESKRTESRTFGEEIVNLCLPHAGVSTRIAVTGAPGVGKSTFVEAFGAQLLDDGHRVAVLAIDPTSEHSGGSVLGDKTRMSIVAAHEKAFVRPSPSSGVSGGLGRATREAIILCEAAGYDVVLVETVGVGQAEWLARSIVDYFLLLVPIDAGDDLQGIKRGIIEMADAVIVTKADGPNADAARAAAGDYRQSLQLFPPRVDGSNRPVVVCSSVTGDGLDEIWAAISTYQAAGRETGDLDRRRREQSIKWLLHVVKREAAEKLLNAPDVRDALTGLSSQVLSGSIDASIAASRFLNDLSWTYPPQLQSGEPDV